MKKVYGVLICCAAMLTCCGKKELTIVGNVDNIGDSLVFMSVLDETFNLQDIDTAKVTDDGFKFSGHDFSQEECVIIRTQKSLIGQIFVGNDNVVIEGDNSKPQEMVIKGSQLTDKLQNFIDNIPEQDNLRKLSIQLENVGNDIDRRSAIIEEINNAREEQKAYIKHFVNSNITSPIAPFVMAHNMTIFTFEEADTLTEKMLKALPTHKYTNTLRNSLEKQRPLHEAMMRVQPGRMAPDFKLPNINGDTITLSDSKGKIVLLDFWASWCKPCRQNNETLVEAYNKFSDLNLEIVSVSVDKDEAKWKEAVKEDKLPGVLLIDKEGKVARTYCVETIPCCYLIDSEGKIQSKDVGGRNIFADIEAMLKKTQEGK